VSYENMRMGCMKEKGAASVCPQCGYDESIPPGPLALPVRTILNRQFVVGRIPENRASESEKVKPQASKAWMKWGLLAVLLLVGVLVSYCHGQQTKHPVF